MALEKMSNTDFGPYVEIDQEEDSLYVKFQKGPICEVGENGAQINVLLEVLIEVFIGFNNALPCRENALAITKLDEARLWILKRKMDREARGVEGTSKI